jgi:hypothetical protein
MTPSKFTAGGGEMGVVCRFVTQPLPLLLHSRGSGGLLPNLPVDLLWPEKGGEESGGAMGSSSAFNKIASTRVQR